jgi:hypothetical protein
MKSIAICIFVSLIVWGCSTPEKELNAGKVIESLKSMSKLGSTEYTLTKILAAEDDNTWYNIGSRKAAIHCKAHVVAGIDASQIQFTEVNTKEKSIKLTIPAVELITFDMPPEEIKLITSDITLARSNFTTVEYNEYQKIAEKKIRKQLKELNINAESEKNAILFLDRVLRSAGFLSIVISTTKSQI